MRKLFVGTIAAVLIGACAHAQPTDEPDPAPDGGIDRVAAAEVLAKEIAVERGLPLLQPVNITVEPPDVFLNALHESDANSRRSFGAEHHSLAATWVAFGMLAPSGLAPDAGISVDQLSGAEAAFDDDRVAGFYDPLDKQLHLRAQLPPGVGRVSDWRREAQLGEEYESHELEHALQDQHFDLQPRAVAPGGEAAVCARAVLEGDATLLEEFHVARSYGVRPERFLAVADERLLHARAAMTPNVPAVVSETRQFPYVAGLHVCWALYRTGGWRLVDELFVHPPVSSQQLLHPEKYLSGVAPTPVATPTLPGASVVDSGTLGEFGARLVFREALPVPQADEVAAGWAGDAYRVGTSPGSKSVILLWASTWQTEEAARWAEEALNTVVAGWVAGGVAAKRWTATAHAVVRRRGRDVVLSRGLDAAAAAAMEDALFSCVGQPPPATPPVGTTAIHSPRAMGWLLEDATFVSDDWALHVHTPPGFGAIAEPPGSIVDLGIGRRRPLAIGEFTARALPYSERQAHQLFQALTAAIPKASYVDEDAFSLGDAQGLERSLDVDTKLGRIRVDLIALPVCAGKKTWTFALQWQDIATRQLLHRWVEDFVSSGPAAACDAK